MAVFDAVIEVHSSFRNKTASPKGIHHHLDPPQTYRPMPKIVRFDSSYVIDQAGSCSAPCMLLLKREAAARL